MMKSNLKDSRFFFLWFGAAVSLSEILTGTFLAPLGLAVGLTVILFGHLIGTSLLVLGGMIGTREKETAIGSTQAAFGNYGKGVFALLNVIQLLGWTAVMLKTGGEQLASASPQTSFFHQATWGVLVMGGITILWMAIRNKTMHRLNSIAVVLLFFLTILLFIELLSHGSFTTARTSGLSIGAGLEMVIVMPISWLPVIADYNRQGRSTKGVAIHSWLGYGIGSAWMYAIGLLLALSHITLNGFLGRAVLVGFLIITLSTVTTTFLDAKSASLSLLLIFPKWHERGVTLLIGLIGLGLALVVPMSHYETFLYLVGSLFSPLYAVVLTHYYVLKMGKSVNVGFGDYVPSFVIWILGVVLYNVFIKINFILGGTLPSMLITAFLYWLIKGRLAVWKSKLISPNIVKE